MQSVATQPLLVHIRLCRSTCFGCWENAYDYTDPLLAERINGWSFRIVERDPVWFGAELDRKDVEIVEQ